MTRIRVTFWSLVLVTILATGALASALDAPPSPVTGLRVAVAGLAAAVAGMLALRIAVVVARHRERGHHGPASTPGPRPAATVTRADRAPKN